MGTEDSRDTKVSGRAATLAGLTSRKNAQPVGPSSAPHPNLNRFLLPNGEHVACVFWNGLYHITGTDIGGFELSSKIELIVSSGFGLPLRGLFAACPQH